MLPKPNAVVTGGLIKATHLNDLVSYYNEIWNDPSTGPFTFTTHNDTSGDNLDRRFGWGQTPATINPTPVASTSANSYNGTVVTLNDINQITAQINAGGYHQEDNVLLAGLIPLTTPVVEDKIPTTLYNSVCSFAKTLETNKYKVDWVNLSLAEVISTNNVSWSDDLEVVHKFVFADYSEARYFFNSGGQFTLELSMPQGGGAYNQVWREIFDQFDSIRIGAESCTVVTDDDNGETHYDIISTSGVNKGFYTGIVYSVTPTFETILDAGVFRYTNSPTNTQAEVFPVPSEYSAYSEYNSRRIRIQLKADEVGSTFNIYVKVILIEDADDGSPITQDITLTSGYVQPTNAPPLGDPSDPGLPYTTVSPIPVARFLERNAPTVTEEQPWTPVLAPDGEQLEDWVDGSTNWTNTGGNSYTKNP